VYNMTMPKRIEKLERKRSLTRQCSCCSRCANGINGMWKRPGVFNVEQCDPDPFMKLLGTLGLAWHEVIDQASPFEEK